MRLIHGALLRLAVVVRRYGVWGAGSVAAAPSFVHCCFASID